MTSDFSTEYVQLDNDDEREPLSMEDVEKFFRDYLDEYFDTLTAAFKHKIMKDFGCELPEDADISKEQLYSSIICTYYMTEFEDPADYVWSVMNETNA